MSYNIKPTVILAVSITAPSQWDDGKKKKKIITDCNLTTVKEKLFDSHTANSQNSSPKQIVRANSHV